MECMRVASPGVPVRHAWENVHVMKGTPPYSVAASSERGSTEEQGSGSLDGVGGGGSGGSGMGMGRLGFSVAEVGRGRRERTVDVKPGTRTTTHFRTHCVFCNR